MADDYLAELQDALDRFEKKLKERWQETMYDCVRRMDWWAPPPVHFRQNYNSAPEVWEYRKP